MDFLHLRVLHPITGVSPDDLVTLVRALRHLRTSCTMSRFNSSLNYEHGASESVGLLLVNVGTPDEPTTSAVRRYLAEFLSDPRVVEVPRLIWWLVLHGYILRTRPIRSAQAYRKIWSDRGSPLLLHTLAIATRMQRALTSRFSSRIQVEVGMSYGNPSIDSALEKMFDLRVRRIVVLPLYPQYSGTTTGSVFDAVTKILSRRRWVPELKFINHYHDAPGYISSLAASVKEHWARHGRGERLLMSFHGLPKAMLLAGDPYHCQCHKTARLLAEVLQLNDNEWQVSFQSRVGRANWLTPYTDKTLETWGKQRVGLIDVICPGFAADCLETLEEIALENARLFEEEGGGQLRYIPALNTREDHLSFLLQTFEENLSGWPEASPDWTTSDTSRQEEESLERAREMGAPM